MLHKKSKVLYLTGDDYGDDGFLKWDQKEEFDEADVVISAHEAEPKILKNRFGEISTREYDLPKSKTLSIPPGYHLRDIPKGVLGTVSKIEEELLELKDAVNQDSWIMVLIEMADMYGAMEEFLRNNFTQEMSMEDLKKFSDITKRAFRNGQRS